MAEQDLLVRLESHLAEAVCLLHEMRRPQSGHKSSDSLNRLTQPKLAYSIREVQPKLGLGRTTIYKATKQGRLKVAKEGAHTDIGYRTLVLARGLTPLSRRARG